MPINDTYCTNIAGINSLKMRATMARIDILQAVYQAQSGHLGGSLSIVDMLIALYFAHMNIRPHEPSWDGRDRLVLSKGHAAPALYAVLAQADFFSRDELLTLRSVKSRLQGHPNLRSTPGVDMSTGSLGQGLSVACGMALSGRITNAPWRVYAIVGDCELEEGQIWEAMMFSSHNELDNLCIIIDNNNTSIDGATNDSNWLYAPIQDKCQAFGMNVLETSGHDFTQIAATLKSAKACKGRPTVIIQKTIKGKGISYMENNSRWHSSIPNEQMYELAMNELLCKLRSYQNE